MDFLESNPANDQETGLKNALEISPGNGRAIVLMSSSVLLTLENHLLTHLSTVSLHP